MNQTEGAEDTMAGVDGVSDSSSACCALAEGHTVGITQTQSIVHQNVLFLSLVQGQGMAGDERNILGDLILRLLCFPAVGRDDSMCVNNLPPLENVQKTKLS